jgi:hypothetical protein
VVIRMTRIEWEFLRRDCPELKLPAKSPALSALEKAQSRPKVLPATLRTSLHEAELNLRDDWNGRLLRWLERCPNCGSPAVFDRTVDIAGNGAFMYVVRCSRFFTGCEDCDYPSTEPVRDLRQACTLWQLSIKLSQ